MKTKIVLYDQKLADAFAGSALCSHQMPPQELDAGQGMEKIANFDEQSTANADCCA
jgi:hypothetical protein